jgi:hypothetical protein
MRVKNKNLEMIWYTFWVNLTEGLRELNWIYMKLIFYEKMRVKLSNFYLLWTPEVLLI